MSIESLYSEHDALGLAELVRRGEVTPLELLEEAILRIETLNPQLNAVIHKMYDKARATTQSELPDGPFKGVPFLLKDLLADYAGEPTASGAHFFKNYIPRKDSELVSRFKSTGVVILGKTSTSEMGILGTCETDLYGPTFNPWDLHRSAGGSSGGSAAAVASGFVPMASGGDGGGSIRIPSSYCGTFGLKPTRGRNPGGIIAGEQWFDLAVEHVLTRSVRDSAAMLDATHGYHTGAIHSPPLPARPYLEEVETEPGKLRIAYTTKPLLGKSMHPDCITGLEATVKLLEGMGHTLIEDAPTIDRIPTAIAYLTLVACGTAASIRLAEEEMGKKARSSDFEAPTWALILVARRMKAKQLIEALQTMQVTARIINEFLKEYDIFLTPTVSTPPPMIGELLLQGPLRTTIELLAGLNAGWVLDAANLITTAADNLLEYVPYTPIGNLAGNPAMSVPLYWNESGLPIGMHFVGKYADEATLFRLAGQLERAQPWFGRRPPLLA
jgi:amidase